MSFAQVAQRYARALLEVGVESGQLAQLTDQIENFASVYRTDRSLQSVLGNPMVSTEARQKVISEIAMRLGLSKTATAAVGVIVARRRLSDIGDIAKALRHMADESSGVLRAKVRYASPLPESYFARLVAALEKATGRRIVLEKEEDPSLIAGVSTQIGDYTVDGSFSGRLARVEQSLASLT